MVLDPAFMSQSESTEMQNTLPHPLDETKTVTVSPKNSSFRQWTFWLGPILCLLFGLGVELDPSQPAAAWAAGITLWMGIWWIGESVPLAITALLPVVLFPFLGVAPTAGIASQYFNSIIFLFLGGFILALALEKWHLHQRIALSILAFFGHSPAQLIWGFMAATAFISMWISNSATTMMMLPIAMAVISKIEGANGYGILSPAERPKFGAAILLAIAYSATIGGCATLVGTPTNMVLIKQFEMHFPDAPVISFSSWMAFAAPIVLALLGCTFLLLVTLICPGLLKKKTGHGFDRKLFQSELKALGPMSGEEKWIGLLFGMAALLWFTRTDINFGSWTFPGWGQWFSQTGPTGKTLEFIDDGTIAMVMALLLFIIPTPSNPSTPLLSWKDAEKVPWGIILLLGGGFALAYGIESSGLAAWFGNQLQGADHWALPPWALLAILGITITALTEVASNVATAQMSLPILASVAAPLGIPPLMLMIPATLFASCGFMMPAGTAPNAIIFSSQQLRVSQMVKIGLVLDIAAIVIVSVAMYWWAPLIFHGTWQ